MLSFIIWDLSKINVSNLFPPDYDVIVYENTPRGIRVSGYKFILYK